MFKIYEDFGDFVDAVKTMDPKTEICMKILPHRDDKNSILSAEIIMQFMGLDGLCHTHHYTDGLKAIRILPSGVFNIISDDKARAGEEQRYEGLLNQFDEITKKEYEKAKLLFNDLGFKNIVNCYITIG